MKVSPKQRGPSRKAKYSLATDSEPSSASERWEEPLSGEDSEPETTRLQAVGARLAGVTRRGVTACLLHNDPATYGPGPGQAALRRSRRETESERGALVPGRRRETT